MTIPIRDRDISGNRLPPPRATGQDYAGGVLTIRPPQFEPPPGAREFIASFSVLAPGGGVLTPLFTLDGNGNLVLPSCAVQLPQDTTARISGVTIGGDTNVGTPILTFSIRDKSGQRAYGGWDAIGLPGRGGVVAVGIEPFTVIYESSAFFGGWVINTDAGNRYAEMMMQGWMW